MQLNKRAKKLNRQARELIAANEGLSLCQQCTRVLDRRGKCHYKKCPQSAQRLKAVEHSREAQG